MADIRYPAHLPCPQTTTVSVKERRAMSEGDPIRYRPIQRNDVQLEQLTFMFRSFQLSQDFMNWFRDDLFDGGAWFSAEWPLPKGKARAVRRFLGVPSFPTFMAAVGWKVSVLSEVRGTGLSDVQGGVAGVGWNVVTPVPIDNWSFSNGNFTGSVIDDGGGGA